MGCTRAQIVALLEKIEAELRDPRDKEVLRTYIEKLKTRAWHEIEMELFYG